MYCIGLKRSRTSACRSGNHLIPPQRLTPGTGRDRPQDYRETAVRSWLSLGPLEVAPSLLRSLSAPQTPTLFLGGLRPQDLRSGGGSAQE